jgi:WD40 repeat protein
VLANRLRLEHLDRAAAREAILGPLARWNELRDESVEIEPQLVAAVLDEVAVEGDAAERSRIEAPYLQLVLERIWDTEREDGSQRLRLETLEALGGARAIVREHLSRALDGLAPAEQDVAASVFEHLVTPSGTKIALREPDLAEYAGVSPEPLRRVLSTLTHERIVHGVDGSDRYEIFHDVLAEPIRSWREQRRIERERQTARKRQRRLAILATLALAALVVVTGLAAWALSERSSARSQARMANARELDATALQQLPIDPNRSVRLALEAARLDSGAAAENVLRQALLADRLLASLRAGGKIGSVAVAPSGGLIAAALPHGTVALLDRQKRRVIREIQTGRPIALVGFLRGDTLVTGAVHGPAREWNARTGKPEEMSGLQVAARAFGGGVQLVPAAGRLRRVIHRAARLTSSPDTRVTAALVTDPGGVVHAWLFTHQGRLLHELPQPGIRDIAFSPNGKLVATAAEDGTTSVWDVRRGKRVRAFINSPRPPAAVAAIAFSPDGRFLATGSGDGGVRVWDVESGQREYLFTGQTNPVTTLAWSPDSRLLATSSLDRTVRLWSIQNLPLLGSTLATLSGNAGAINSLAFTAGGRLVTGALDGTVRVWDARPEQRLRFLGRGPGAASLALWRGETILGLWSSGIVQTYDASTRRRTHVFRSSTGAALTAVDGSADGGVIATGAADGTTDTWNGHTGALLGSQAASVPVSAVSVSARGDLAASGNVVGRVSVWSPHAAGKPLWTAHQVGNVSLAAFSPEGDVLATVGPGTVVLWAARSGERLHALVAAGTEALAFSSDGRLVATAGSDGNLRLWRTADGTLYRLLRGGHGKPLTGVAFSPDGRVVFTSGDDFDARAWQVASGSGRVLERASFGPLRGIAVDPRGRWVAGAAPITALLWSAVSGRQLFYLRGHTKVLTSVAFAPGGTTVLSSSRDGTLRTYTCAICGGLNSLVQEADERLARTR